MSEEKEREKLEALVQGYLDGVLSASERLELSRALREDAEARRMFLGAGRLHAALRAATMDEAVEEAQVAFPAREIPDADEKIPAPITEELVLAEQKATGVAPLAPVAQARLRERERERIERWENGKLPAAVPAEPRGTCGQFPPGALRSSRQADLREKRERAHSTTLAANLVGAACALFLMGMIALFLKDKLISNEGETEANYGFRREFSRRQEVTAYQRKTRDVTYRQPLPPSGPLLPPESAGKPIEERAIAKPVPPRLTPADRALAQATTRQARQLIEEFDFAGALALCQQAEKKDPGEAARQEFQMVRATAENFHLATRHIEVVPHALARKDQPVVEIALKGAGESLVGILKGERPEGWRIQVLPQDNPAAPGTSIVEVPADRAAAPPEIVSPAEIRQRFRNYLDRVAAGLQPKTAVDYYNLVFLSRRLNLNDRCLAYLKAAYALDAHLGETFRRTVVADAVDRATIYMNAGRGDLACRIVDRLVEELDDYPPAVAARHQVREMIAGMRANRPTTIALVERPSPPALATLLPTHPPPATTTPQPGAEAKVPAPPPTIALVKRPSPPASATLLPVQPPPATTAPQPRPEAKLPAPLPTRREVRQQVAEAQNEEERSPLDFTAREVACSANVRTAVEKANQDFNEAIELYKRAYGGDVDAGNRAVRLLESCAEAYEKAAAQDPAHKEVLEARAGEAGRFCYALRFRIASMTGTFIQRR